MGIGIRDQREFDKAPPKIGSKLRPEGWSPGEPGHRTMVSYALEQKVWAVCYLSPEIIDPKGRCASKIRRLMVGGADAAPTSISRALVQLEGKNITRLVRGGVRNSISGVYMVDTERAPASWAVRELRDQIENRQAGADPPEAKMPADYQATPEHLRSNGQVAYVPAVRAKAEPPGEMDMGAVADALLVKVTEMIAHPPKSMANKAMAAELEEARRYAFMLEGQVNASKAQVAQLEQNVAAAVQAAKDLAGQNELLRSRAAKDEEKERHRSRNYKITEAMSPESRAALSALAKS